MLPALIAISIGNPVIRAEFHHQRFIIQRGRVGFVWIGLAALLLLPALLLALGYTFIMLFAPLLPDLARFMPAYNGGEPLLLLTLTIAHYLVVTLVSLSLAANSIRREKKGKTWDNLRLTALSAGQIVTGKWWASLRALIGDHIMVIIIRSGMIAVYLGTLAPLLGPLYNNADPDYSRYMPAMLVFCWVYGVLDAALTAALGVLASLPDDTPGLMMGIAAGVLRILTMAAACIWLIYSLEAVLHSGYALLSLYFLIGVSVYLLCIGGILLLARRFVN